MLGVHASVLEQGEVYRMYNPNTGEHFYTKNPQERDMLSGAGWDHEAGQNEVAIEAEDPGANPVYRVYNPNSGLHHYTTNQAEANMLKSVGWDYEGFSFYAFDKGDTQGTPMYRAYCPFPDANGQNQHVYTTNRAEVDYLVGLGYHDEGTAWRIKK